jgi:hypothetical protein
MALNWTMLSPERAPVPLPHELIIRTIESPSVDITLFIPSAVHTGSSTSSSSKDPDNEKKISASGGLWLTDQRVRATTAILNLIPDTDTYYGSLHPSAHIRLSCEVL